MGNSLFCCYKTENEEYCPLFYQYNNNNERLIISQDFFYYYTKNNIDTNLTINKIPNDLEQSDSESEIELCEIYENNNQLNNLTYVNHEYIQ